MTLLSTLNSARLGLTASQTAMSIISNNIANVNTEGYHRQRVELEPSKQGGVNVSGITRFRDEFLGSQYRQSQSGLGAQVQLALNLQQVQTILGESQDGGASPTMQAFFSALNELTVNPSGATERQTVVSRADDMMTNFNSISLQLTDMRQQLNREIENQVGQVNTILDEIVEINRVIGERGSNQSVAGSSGENFYALVDRRDKLIDELATIVPVRSLPQKNGSLTLFMNDRVLLEGVNRKTIELNTNPSNDGLYDVVIRDVAGKPVDIRDSLKGTGSLAGLLISRDDHAGGAQKELDRMVAKLSRDFNAIHAQGYGLDSVTGRNFFTEPTASGYALASNRGGVQVASPTVTDTSLLTFDDYEIRFTTDNTFDVVNATTGASVSTGNTYPPGGPVAVDFDGIQVTLQTGSGGGPRTGDVFVVNSFSKASINLDFDPAIAASTDAIAAAGAPDLGGQVAVGDNRNALDLVGLGYATQMGNGMTYQDFYDNIRLNIASEASRAQDNALDEEVRHAQVQGLKDSVSGVSLDDEAIDIIQYQRAYQAASRVISVTDELMNTLVNII